MAMSNFRGASPDGRAKGFGFYYSHLGYFAEVVEASLDARNAVEVHNVWAAGDVGSHIINPFGALNQVEGSIIDGLGQAVALAVEIENGGAKPVELPRIPAAAHADDAEDRGRVRQVGQRARPAWASPRCRR